jgi:hypothetical protein
MSCLLVLYDRFVSSDQNDLQWSQVKRYILGSSSFQIQSLKTVSYRFFYIRSCCQPFDSHRGLVETFLTVYVGWTVWRYSEGQGQIDTDLLMNNLLTRSSRIGRLVCTMGTCGEIVHQLLNKRYGLGSKRGSIPKEWES